MSTEVGTQAGAAGTPALEIRDLHAWYGESHILHGVDLTVNRGEVVTLLGRNGAGRTTLRAIMGLTGARKGSIRVNGRETIQLPTHKIAHCGIGYCPGARHLLQPVVRGEPAAAAAPERGAGMSEAEIYEMFPNLKERRQSQGTRLSGGEQQMLAVGRILRTGANLLLLDEISEGLAPVIVQALARMILTLKKKGYTVVMVEQNFRFAAPLADRFYVMEHGAIVERFGAAELQQKMPVLHELLGSDPRERVAAWCKSSNRRRRGPQLRRQAMKMTRLAAAMAALAMGTVSGMAAAQVSGDTVKIGYITDMSGLYADIDGPGGLEAIKMAIEDAGGKVLGKPIELVSADHQNKADIAASKAREWMDQQRPDVLIGGTNSATGLAMNKVAAEKKRVYFNIGAGTARLTNEECTPYTVHYAYDTVALAKAPAARWSSRAASRGSS